ncbi:MAG: acyl-CoA dehydrogenase family protein [Actinomycetota bacterium]|nr:acyl-CoA dehydrogenase family protein [Actinomycetota bacterium]
MATSSILADARKLVDELIDPLADQWETERRFARESFDAAAQLGLTALLVPEAQGGRGLGPLAFVRVFEVLASADLAAAFSLVVHNNFARGLAASGNQHLIDLLLADTVSGAAMGAFLLTEPGTGSDASAITCSAVLDGDEWVIKGDKAWITNASDATALNVYAQTNPALKHRGIVSIVVDAATPGVTRLEPYELLGGHAMGTGGFRFDDVRVSRNNTLSPVGEAFGAAMVGIDLARVVVGAMCCGMLQRALDVAVEHSRSRQLFGGSVADKQGVQWMLADVATDLEASRLLTFRAAEALEAESDATIAAAHAKKFSVRAAERGIAACMQTMGATGFRRAVDNPLPRHLAGARIAAYIDGTW